MSTVLPAERAVTLPGAPRSVGVARHFLRDFLDDSRVSADVADVATLLLSELVTNAVLHAGTGVSIRCILTEPAPPSAAPGVLVTVSDGSPSLPRPRAHLPEAVTGRGLELVELLAEHSGVQRTATGKVVWFSLSGAGTPAGAGWSDGPVEPAAPVLLQGLPVLLYDVLAEHDESLLREYELYRLDPHRRAASSDSDGYRQPDVAPAARARLDLAAAVRAAAGPAVPGHGPLRADITVRVPAGELGTWESLRGVFAAAEAAAVAGALLTRPALPELVALREWLFGQVVDQLRGGPAVPWAAGAHPESPPSSPPVAVDLSWVPRTRRAVVVADDSHLILAVSPAAAALLGWAADDLTGRRLTTIIPARLHEAHLAGFARHMVTGRDVLIGREVTVPALHRDGHEVAVRLSLELVRADQRNVYLGWLSPA